jgi:hypothetical protein
VSGYASWHVLTAADVGTGTPLADLTQTVTGWNGPVYAPGDLDGDGLAEVLVADNPRGLPPYAYEVVTPALGPDAWLRVESADTMSDPTGIDIEGGGVASLLFGTGDAIVALNLAGLTGTVDSSAATTRIEPGAGEALGAVFPAEEGVLGVPRSDGGVASTLLFGFDSLVGVVGTGSALACVWGAADGAIDDWWVGSPALTAASPWDLDDPRAFYVLDPSRDDAAGSPCVP